MSVRLTLDLMVRAVLVAVFATCASALSAQVPEGTGRILGRVLNAETGDPIPGVSARVVGVEDSERLTNAQGRFLVLNVPPGRHDVELSHLVYGTHTQVVEVPTGGAVEVVVRLSPDPIELEPIEVEISERDRALGLVGFYERMASEEGSYFFNDDFTRRRSLGAVLMMAPYLRAGGGGPPEFPHGGRFGEDCEPTYWIDGREFRMRGVSVEQMVDPFSIIGMEVYRPEETPEEFWSRDLCGAIVIWTEQGTPR